MHEAKSLHCSPPVVVSTILDAIAPGASLLAASADNANMLTMSYDSPNSVRSMSGVVPFIPMRRPLSSLAGAFVGGGAVVGMADIVGGTDEADCWVVRSGRELVAEAASSSLVDRAMIIPPSTARTAARTHPAAARITNVRRRRLPEP